MTRIVVIGKNGQLGSELLPLLQDRYETMALGSTDLDLADSQAIRAMLREFKPQIVINAAAYTAVDRAESEPELAMAVNGIAPGVIAEELRSLNGCLIHYSTDYVFNGDSERPYQESDTPDPQSVYGQTKLAGERAVQEVGVPYLIFRTSWVYGHRGHNFFRTMLRLLQERDEIRVVDDQVGAPTWTRQLAKATSDIIGQVPDDDYPGWMAERSGIYHMSCRGKTTWYGFTQAIASYLAGKGVQVANVVPISTAEYPLPAKRPHWSVLENARLLETFGVKLLDWETAFEQLLASQDFHLEPGGR